MKNIPQIKLGIIAVSRDCFPIELSGERCSMVVSQCNKKGIEVFKSSITVENENDAMAALYEIKQNDVNALIIYLGNFGPEGPETMMAAKFDGPCMFAAASEETAAGLMGKRGDAYCGMLNASYNIGLRNIRPYIPEIPVGTASEVADMISDFTSIARIIIGVSSLKMISFGPRPYDFLACNAPIKPLYNLGVEVMENSELDLFELYNQHADDVRIPELTAEMAADLGHGNKMPGILDKLAQYELTLKDFIDDNIGASKYVAIANKCWPAFQTQFGFVPCYVNSRFMTNLIPAACEVDIYGALSEYIIACATEMPATLLDINNTVPNDMYVSEIKGKFDYKSTDVFMAFHCGNTPGCFVRKPEMKYQVIMHSLLEPDEEPNITRGTLEGDLIASDITFFRLQSTADAKFKSYIAEGEVLPTDTQTFGSTGVFAIPEMARFYRHVLIEERYPHHGAVAFKKTGKIIFAALNMMGIDDIKFNQPKGMLYPTENPFI